MTSGMILSEGVAFLKSLAKNNRREWFQPRKEVFETKLRDPMLEVIEAVNKELFKFAPEHVTDPKKAIYRIYRDTRFSSDKSPYKTHLAAVFPRRGLDRQAGAGFYFHVSTKAVGIAAGCYMPDKDGLRAVRLWLSENYETFRKGARKPKKLWGDLQGSSMKRMPKGFDPEHPAADLIKMTHWMYWVELDLKIASSPKLVKELASRFRAAAPVVAMLNAPLLAKKTVSRAVSLG